MNLFYALAVAALGVGLVVFSYLDRIYRELGRVTTGHVHTHLEIFENEIEPQFHLERARAATGFRLLANLWLVIVTAETARGVIVFVPGTWDALAQALVYVLVEVLLFSQFIPDFLLVRTTGRWLVRFALVIRAFLWIVWPFRVLLELAVSLARISDDHPSDSSTSQQEGIEALVDAAEQEGILERSEAQMIEQVVEFSDKRVLEFMTPRPDVVSISADSTVEQLRQLLIQTRFSRVPVYDRIMWKSRAGRFVISGRPTDTRCTPPVAPRSRSCALPSCTSACRTSPRRRGTPTRRESASISSMRATAASAASGTSRHTMQARTRDDVHQLSPMSPFRRRLALEPGPRSAEIRRPTSPRHLGNPRST